MAGLQLGDAETDAAIAQSVQVHTRRPSSRQVERVVSAGKATLCIELLFNVDTCEHISAASSLSKKKQENAAYVIFCVGTAGCAGNRYLC